MSITLQEVIVVGAHADQVKFSELTLDMFRMLQTLEREPQEDLAHIYDQSPGGAMAGHGRFENGNAGGKGRDNPHKYLLYKPSVTQMLVFLASGQRELPANAAMMLYVSGDGCFSTKPAPDDASYDVGGILLSTKKDPTEQPLQSSKRLLHVKDSNW